MQPSDPLRAPLRELRNLSWVVAATSAAFAVIVWPFLGAVLWAVFIAIVFEPVHARVRRQAGPRATLAALLTLSLIVLIVILPLILVGNAVVHEASNLVQQVRSGDINLALYVERALDALPGWGRSILERYGIVNLAALQRQLSAALAGSGQFITSHLLGLGQNTLDFVVSLFVMLYLLFFMLRDGHSLTARIAHAIPLEPLHTQRLLSQFVTVVRATVKGNVVIALVQGMLGGIAFAVLDLPASLMWGTLMALLSLLPAVGAALVWVPVAAWLLLSGQVWPAVGLALWGTLVMGLIDNVLRPILVGKNTRLPDYLVLLSTLGGIAIFGINGFVIGPVIAAMFLVAWNLFAASRQRTATDEGA